MTCKCMQPPLLRDARLGIARHGDDKSTSNFCPSASAHLCSVANVGLSVLPVSKRDSAGGSMPIRSATSANVNLCREKMLGIF